MLGVGCQGRFPAERSLEPRNRMSLAEMAFLVEGQMGKRLEASGVLCGCVHVSPWLRAPERQCWSLGIRAGGQET